MWSATPKPTPTITYYLVHGWNWRLEKKSWIKYRLWECHPSLITDSSQLKATHMRLPASRADVCNRYKTAGRTCMALHIAVSNYNPSTYASFGWNRSITGTCMTESPRYSCCQGESAASATTYTGNSPRPYRRHARHPTHAKVTASAQVWRQRRRRAQVKRQIPGNATELWTSPAFCKQTQCRIPSTAMAFLPDCK